MEISIYNPIPYYTLVFLYLIFYYCSTYLKNPFIAIWIFFGIFPILDQILSMDLQNPTKEQQKELKNMVRFKIPLILTISLDWILLFWGIREIIKNEHGYLYNLGILLIMIVFEGASINTSHELNHKIKKFDNIFGTLNLSKAFYMHFLIEHNQGHHRNVATYDDPASSRLNESIYKFFPRTVFCTYISAWEIENKNCFEKYETAFTWKNRMIYFTVAILLFPVLFYCLFGLLGMLLQIIIGIGSFLLLEIVNYIEHYGLERKKLENGNYENVNNTHSWNAPHRMTNYILFKLQRHSDHHENALKPYQILCTHEDSPLLPNGYALCMLLALYPKLWFKIMNPLIEIYKKSEKPKKEFLSSINEKITQFIIKVNIFLLSLVFLQFGANVLL